MCHELSLSASFLMMLSRIDERRVAAVQREGCRYCGGRLDRADYWRKPRGVNRLKLPAEAARRHSLCCANEGCRRRCTPPPVRFLGRHVYVGLVLVLSCSTRVGAVKLLGARLSVPAWTLRRWRAWWQGQFTGQAGWRALRLRLAEPIDASRLPEALWGRFGPARSTTLLRLLKQIRSLADWRLSAINEG